MEEQPRKTFQKVEGRPQKKAYTKSLKKERGKKGGVVESGGGG